MKIPTEPIYIFHIFCLENIFFSNLLFPTWQQLSSILLSKINKIWVDTILFQANDIILVRPWCRFGG